MVKMLMEIDPHLMRGSLVMTMVMISPSRKEVSPAEQLCRSSRLVPPRFRLVAAVFLPESLPMIFFQGKRLHIAEDGNRRPTRGPMRQGARPGVGCAPLPRGPPNSPPAAIFYYMKSFTLEKNHKQALGTKHRHHEAEPWRNQSRAPAELFCGETSLQEGEIITIIITNDPLIGRGSISINIFTSTISSQTLVHLLYPILSPEL